MRAAVHLAAAALLVGLTGCGSEISISLQLRSDPPIEPELSRERVVIAEGMAVGVVARVFEDDEPEDEHDPVELVSNDTGVLDVRPGIEPGQFVLVARRAGSTTIDAFVGDEPALPLEVVVEPQEVAPAP